MVFPQVVFGGNWSTDIAIGNSSAGTQVAKIDFFNSAGAAIGTLADIVIPAKGVISIVATDTITVIR